MNFDKASFSALAFAIIGLIVFGIGLFLYNNDSSILSNWQKTKGEIISSNIMQMPTAGTGRSFTANISYKYDFNGKTYRSACCDYGSADYDRWAALVQKNPSGAQSDVLVDPNDPTKSALKDSIQPANILVMVLMAAGVFVFFAGIVSTYLALTSK